ncbi:OmpP1/FadL family transporter [Bacterioplanoides sp. SCSIO 12839]|uniref:OmpP1/FadL family transporter n=1 Tax=Bacterioplanoides sp. SCSIO 12839 TaxID=2829569 RepID=UPI002108329B|nr:outer membrane protein transport protein [Bacterioplanoides sp. SCSIO 12839]UTW46831.1 outer membrane protein transport protein [Bacterioplanoides sp. SCSIO 12839]
MTITKRYAQRWIAAGSAFLFCGLINQASAQLSQNLFLDTKAMALGNAVTADPVGIMDIHFNPAGLTKLDGRQIQFQMMNVVLAAEAEFALPKDYNEDDAGLLNVADDPILKEGKSRATAAAYIPGVGLQELSLPILTLPTGGISIKPPGSKFTFANAVYAPMAAGFAKADDDPGRYQAKQVALQRFTYLSPSFGYQVTDEFSVGASFLFSHQAVAVVQDLRAPNVLLGVIEELQGAFGCFDDDGNNTGNDPLAPLVTLCGGDVGPYDDIGELSVTTEESLSPSFNVGFLWEPTDWFGFGVGYQSEATSNLKGTFELNYDDEFSGFFRKFRSSIVGAIGGAIFGLPDGRTKEAGNVSIELTYPQHLQVGTKFRFLDKFQINVDAGWTDFEKWDSLLLEFDRPVSFLGTARTLAPGLVTNTTLEQPMNFQSVWSFGFGFQYDLNSRVQLRAGYEPRQTSIPDDARSLQAPLGYAELYSLGMGYQWDLDTVIDFSLSFMQSKETILADPQGSTDFPNSSNSLNRNCLTCTVTNPYPGLDVKTKLTIGAAGFSFRTKF